MNCGCVTFTSINTMILKTLIDGDRMLFILDGHLLWWSKGMSLIFWYYPLSP